MDRRHYLRHAITLAIVVAVAIAPAVGCRSVLTTAMYLINGTDVDPEYDGLKGKKVAVVCRPMVSLQCRNPNVSRDLAQVVTMLLQEKVPKVKTVDQRKIRKWTDENTWDEYHEVGKAMKADMVVGIDLNGFDLYQGQTLYQGRASASIRVYDCKNGNKLVFQKELPGTVYPPNIGIPTSERGEQQFCTQFIAILADQIGRHFYKHDAYADIAQDARALH